VFVELTVVALSPWWEHSGRFHLRKGVVAMLHQSEVLVERAPREGFPVNVEYRVNAAPQALLVALYVRDRLGLDRVVRWPSLPRLVPPVDALATTDDLRLLSMQWERWWSLLWEGNDVSEALRTHGFEELADEFSGCADGCEHWVREARLLLTDAVKATRQPLGSADGLFPGRSALIRETFGGTRSRVPLAFDLNVTVLPVAGETLTWLSTSAVVVGADLFLDDSRMRAELMAAFALDYGRMWWRPPPTTSFWLRSQVIFVLTRGRPIEQEMIPKSTYTVPDS
jgi:hypothetical protein